MKALLNAVTKTLLVVGVLVGSLLGVLIAGGVVLEVKTTEEQAVLEPFYTPPTPLPNMPAGTLLRQEQVTDASVPGATVWRVLYTTELADGSPAVSGGLVFVPTVPAPNPDGTRPVVAWAHGTVGQGDACAPSRSKVLFDTNGWLDQMMSLGWLVTATDYAGLGTPGPSTYLVGQSEVNDLVNSIRAARLVPGAAPGKDWVAWGHSQGGHASLWAGHLGQEAAPELRLRGVAAAAPAANLAEIVHAQWNTPIGWLIGPEVSQSWPHEYSALGAVLPSTLTSHGLDAVNSISDDCLVEGVLVSVGRNASGEKFFKTDPTENAVWLTVIKDQTPAPLPSSVPVFVAQGTADDTVLPEPQALLQEQWCAAGSDLSMLWMGGLLMWRPPVLPGLQRWTGLRTGSRDDLLPHGHVMCRRR